MTFTPHPKLSDSIRSVIRERIVNGDLAPGTRINEVHLSEELQVSRTPLREALTALVAEGALESVPRRGVFVQPLSVEELQHIYPIRGLLDPAAFRLSGLPSASRIRQLEELNQRMREEPDAAARVRLDDRWHLTLVAGCPNPVLLELIGQFMLRTRRYELAFYRERRNVEITLADHERVIAAAKRGDMEGAVAALERNLTSGFGPIVAWLEEQRVTAGPADEEEVS